MSARWTGWLLGIAVAVHLLALYTPGSPEPTLPELPVPQLDKLVHVGLFALPAFLARRLTRAWWPVVALLVHAPTSELVQYRFIPHRSGDPADLVADVVGIGLGVWAAHLGQRRAPEPDFVDATLEG
ncbi:hypothetical protein GCM10028820_00830 [Tessaracoccus terricola]